MNTKNFEKIEKSIETKADKETIWELKDLVRDFAHKDSIVEIEKKVFPIISTIIHKVVNFDENIKENKEIMMRIDELLLDKANKYDLISLQTKLSKCVNNEEF